MPRHIHRQSSGGKPLRPGIGRRDGIDEGRAHQIGGRAQFVCLHDLRAADGGHAPFKNSLVVGAFAAFLVGAVVSVTVLMARGGDRKTQVPFGPFMLLGVLIGIYAGHPLAHAYTHSLNH